MATDTASEHPFTWDHYREILSVGLEQGYRYVRFCDDPLEDNGHRVRNEKRLYLRHDIENDIAAARHMAAIEHESGIRSTYFVLLRSANYNPAERRCVHMLDEIRSMGHDVGLHFSLIDHPALDIEHDLEDLIREDADLLSRILRSSIRVFSFHNPPADGRIFQSVDGLINAYAAPYFQHAYYMSDSNVHWHRGCPCQLLRDGSHEAIQLLTHPNTYSGNFSTDHDVLLHFLRNKIADLLAYNTAQSRVLQRDPWSIKSLLDRIKKSEASS